MRLKVCIEIETKDYPLKDFLEDVDFKGDITEADFDSRAAELSEHMEKEIMEGKDNPLEKLKIYIVRMGR